MAVVAVGRVRLWCATCREVGSGKKDHCRRCGALLVRRSEEPAAACDGALAEREAEARRAARSYPVPEHVRPGARPTVVKVCRVCGESRPHGVRPDRPGQGRDRCLRCSRAYYKGWRARNWRAVKLRDTWRGMVARCHEPEKMRRWARASGIPNARDYADAGVEVCPWWRDPELGLARFSEDVGDPPSRSHTLDRIDTVLGYSCGRCADCRAGGLAPNVRWASKKLQDRNRKNSRFVEALHGGETRLLTLGEWSALSGIGRSTIGRRLDRGWEAQRAVFERTRARPRRAGSVPF